MEYEGTSCTVARCGLPAGCTSRVFSLAEFADALLATDRPLTVYVERDGAGRLAGCGGASVELAAACARLAPHPPARTAALQLAGGGSAGEGGALRLSCVRALAPHDELLLWPDDALLATAAVPVLAPIHIRGGADYRCDVCGARFDQPNPLKMHLYLGCAPPGPGPFWRRLLAHVTSAAPRPAPAQPPPPPSPAALEALAAAWGAWNARGAGHACLYCGKLYSRKYGLKIHIRTHTGYKPLRCAHCARRFGDPSNLNKHVRLHAASAGSALAARHVCAQCGAVLARRRDLERHVRARHGAPVLPSPSPALPAG